MDIPIVREPVLRTPWFNKFAECFFAGVAPFNSLLMFILVVPRDLLMKLGPLFFTALLLGQLVIGIGFALGYAFYWHHKETRKWIGSEPRHRIDSGKRHAWLQGILRYWLAFEIATYGFGKILRTQFAVFYQRDDMPVGKLSGFELTWNYFGYSYTLAVIIALLQIGGAILLLSRRTTLLGVVILLPLMVNIVLINLFYHIAAGAFMNSILFTLGLLYLLLLRKKEILKVFLAPGTDLPVVRLGVLKYLFRFLAIACAFGILFYAVRRSPVSPMAGKWKIDRLVRNRDTIKANAWLTDGKAWTTVYMEERGTLTFCPNPYIYEGTRSDPTFYTYDNARRQLQIVFQKNRGDTAQIRVSHYDGRNMEWSGVIDNDTVSLQLSKVEKSRTGPQ